MRAGVDSPYPLGAPVTDLRLLQARRAEIENALEAMSSPESGGNRHVVILGEQRSGRSTVLREVARRAAAATGHLIVPVRGLNTGVCSRQHFVKCMLLAVVDTLSRATDGSAEPWYRAWRDRVYLRDRSPCAERDLLSSALMLAADSDASIDQTLIEHDLRALRTCAQSAGFSGIILTIDDASAVTEDVDLVEEILGVFDVVEGYRLLFASLPATASHFVDAASPCLARFVPVWLRPFRGLHQIYGLSSPFGGEKHGNRPRSRCYSAASAFGRADRKLPTFRPCPFRRPSMAGARRPRAGTPLRHKHRENAARCVWREWPAQPAETQARRHVLTGLSRLGREVTDARDARSGLPGRGQLRADSPPNEQESRFTCRSVRR